MKGYALRQLSANGVQLVLNQSLSIAIFYLLSVRLSKPDFGRLNMAFAILLGLFGALTLGIDSLAVKKTAAGSDRRSLLRTYLFHVLVTGIPGLALLWLTAPWLPEKLFPLLPLIGVGKFFIFLSTPFKQITSGREKFSVLARMSLVSNVIRCGGLLVLMVGGRLTLPLAVLVFVVGDLAELVVSIFLFRRVERENPAAADLFHREATPGKKKFLRLAEQWGMLLREASPQAGVVIITALLARFDWICIGFISTATRLAEYSFAYKAFEMAQLPLLVIAPLLLPRFTRFFRTGVQQEEKLRLLLHGELFVAAGSALLIQAAWAPLIDLVTAGRYGIVNRPTIILLCCSLPLIYINNFLWTALFAMGRLRSILLSFVLAAIVNVVGCLVLIPVFGNAGAAIAFLLSMAAQTSFYLLQSPQPVFRSAWKPLALYGSCALLSGCVGTFFPNPAGCLFSSAFLYLSLVGFLSPLPSIALKNMRGGAGHYATRQPANP